MEFLGEIKMDPEKLIRQDPFLNLLPMIKKIRNRIFSDIALNGFCNAFPVIGWKINENGDIVLVDGNTRTDGSIKVGIKKIPVKLYTFEDEQEAIKLALKSIGNTRPKNDLVILHAIRKLDSRSKRGVATGKGSTREILAELLGTSSAKVGKAFTVIDFCNDPVFKDREKELINIVKNCSINKAAIEARKIRKEREYLIGSTNQCKNIETGKKLNGSSDQFHLPPGVASVRLVIRSEKIQAKTFYIREEERPKIESQLLEWLEKLSITNFLNKNN